MAEEISYKKMTRKADKDLEGKVIAKLGKQSNQKLKHIRIHFGIPICFLCVKRLLFGYKFGALKLQRSIAAQFCFQSNYFLRGKSQDFCQISFCFRRQIRMINIAHIKVYR